MASNHYIDNAVTKGNDNIAVSYNTGARLIVLNPVLIKPMIVFKKNEVGLSTFVEPLSFDTNQGSITLVISY